MIGQFPIHAKGLSKFNGDAREMHSVKLWLVDGYYMFSMCMEEGQDLNNHTDKTLEVMD